MLEDSMEDPEIKLRSSLPSEPPHFPLGATESSAVAQAGFELNTILFSLSNARKPEEGIGSPGTRIQKVVDSLAWILGTKPKCL